ncbi:hypothetical protein [Methylophaga sp.]|uniref:hypothetical protein n=1 Tax=Methylophaga sp. TaxID=2024840 RepID=UPI0025D4289B|nr:hypothetical protein [Methylophaga sp.]
MDVKEVLSILSNNVNDIEYSSLLYENCKEKYLFFLALFFFGSYIIAAFFLPLLALAFATISLILFVLYSISSYVGSKEFIKNPIRFYVGELNEDLDIENVRMEKLSNYSKETLREVKDILEFENQRFTSKVSQIAGSINKVGMFPSILALLYAFHQHSTATDSESIIPALILLGFMMGFYFGLFLIQRIMSWQNYGIYLLNKALNLKIDP